MDTVLDFLAQNKLVIGSVLGGVVLFWDKVKALPSMFKGLLPKKSTVAQASAEDVEEADQAALRHLRDRAQSSGNQDLIKAIRSIDMMFYDIHVGAKNESK